MRSIDIQRSARAALAEFNLHDAKLTDLNRPINAAFRVDTKDNQRFVLRLRSMDRFNDSAARVQLKWLERLSQQTTIGSPLPRLTSSGKLFTHANVGGSRWRTTCLTWVAGRSSTSSSFLKPKMLRVIGQTTAKLHKNAEKFRPAGLKECPQLHSKFFFGPGTSVGRAGREFLSADEHDIVRRAADRVRRVMRRTANSSAHIGIIHGDLEPPNWVIAAGVPRPVDFDEFGVGPFALDLMEVLWTHAMWKDYPRYRDDLLAGYESVRPMSDQDRQELEFYQALAFFVWLNRGVREAKDDEYRQWIAPTVRRIGDLCGVK